MMSSTLLGSEHGQDSAKGWKAESHHKSMWTVWLVVLGHSGSFWIISYDKFIHATVITMKKLLLKF